MDWLSSQQPQLYESWIDWRKELWAL